MKNYIVPIIAVIVAVIATATYLISQYVGNSQQVPTINDYEAPDLQHSIYTVPVEEDLDVLTVGTKKMYGDASYVTVELVERTVSEDKDGNCTTNYDKYIVSEVNIKEQRDWTEDYFYTFAEDNFNDEKVSKISFEEGFGFSYAGLSGWQLYEELLNQNHINTEDLSNVTFDAETYQRTGQKLYVFNKRQEIIDKLLYGEVYDKIVDTKVYYEVTESEKGILIPDNFYAAVTYEYDGYTITKSSFLQVYVNSYDLSKEGLDAEN